MLTNTQLQNLVRRFNTYIDAIPGAFAPEKQSLKRLVKQRLLLDEVTNQNIRFRMIRLIMKYFGHVKSVNLKHQLYEHGVATQEAGTQNWAIGPFDDFLPGLKIKVSAEDRKVKLFNAKNERVDEFIDNGHNEQIITIFRIAALIWAHQEWLKEVDAEEPVTTAAHRAQLNRLIESEVYMLYVIRACTQASYSIVADRQRAAFQRIARGIMARMRALGDSNLVILPAGYVVRVRNALNQLVVRGGGHAIYATYMKRDNRIHVQFHNYGMGYRSKGHFHEPAQRGGPVSPYVYRPVPLPASGGMDDNALDSDLGRHVLALLMGRYSTLAPYATMTRDQHLTRIYNSLPAGYKQTQSQVAKQHLPPQSVGNCSWYNQAFLHCRIFDLRRSKWLEKDERFFAKSFMRYYCYSYNPWTDKRIDKTSDDSTSDSAEYNKLIQELTQPSWSDSVGAKTILGGLAAIGLFAYSYYSKSGSNSNNKGSFFNFRK